MDIRDRLNRISKSIGEGTTKAVEKSEDFLEISKLNHSISVNKEKTEEIYREIGRKLYRKYSKGGKVEGTFVEYFNEIDALQKSTQNLEKKIYRIKRIKLCPFCGREIGKGACFCPKCGKVQ